MGRSIVLYTVSLLSRDSCERAFTSQLMFLSLSSSWYRLAFMWDTKTMQVKLRGYEWLIKYLNLKYQDQYFTNEGTAIDPREQL